VNQDCSRSRATSTTGLLEQLGVQVTVQPANVGPLAFGTSVRFRSSNTSVPGALSMTWIDVRSEAEAEDVKQRSRAIGAEMARVPGFIGWVGIGIAERLYTITLWDDPETIGQLRANSLHKVAAREVFETDFGAAVMTALIIAIRVNVSLLRTSQRSRFAAL
jgi:hypothetical protein